MSNTDPNTPGIEDVPSGADERKEAQAADPVLAYIEAFFVALGRDKVPDQATIAKTDLWMLITEIQALRRQTGGETGPQAPEEMLETYWMRNQQAGDANAAVLRFLVTGHQKMGRALAQLIGGVTRLREEIEQAGVELPKHPPQGVSDHGDDVIKCAWCKGTGALKEKGDCGRCEGSGAEPVELPEPKGEADAGEAEA